jgi:RHS repeat-associated protein
VYAESEYQYDAADRLKSVIYPDGETVNVTYTSQGLPATLAGRSTYVSSTTHDVAGRVDIRTLGNVRTDYNFYPWTAGNIGGRLQHMRSGISGGTELQNLTYYYDAAGNVTRIRDDNNSGQRQCFVYDALNRLEQAFIGDTNCAPITAPPVGNGFYAPESYSYGPNGNLMSKTGIGAYTYDAPVSGCIVGTLPTKPHAVRQAGANTYSYDCNGNLIGRSVQGIDSSLTYDAENRLTRMSVTTPPVSMNDFAYDGDGGRVKMSVGSGDGAVITAYAADLYEQTTRYQETFDDGVAQAWTAASGTWAVANSTYQQTGGGSNTNAYRQVSQAGPLYYRWVTTYTSGTNAGLYLFASTGTGAERGNSYRIWQDASTVRIFENASNVATQRASWPAANAAGQKHSYGIFYDPATGSFKVTRDGVTLGSWTDATPLSGGASLFLSLRTDATSAQFDDIAVSDISKYYVSGEQRVGVRNKDGLRYLLTDHLGSTTVTTNGGVRSGELWYKPWGEYRGTAFGITPTTYRFTGQREDASTGLYFYNARYYDVALSRFIQADTIVPEPGDPQSLNRYSYGLGNPVKYADPSGHAPEWLNNAWSYVSGASAQYLDDVSLGAWSALVVKVDLDLIDNEAYQQGRETGRSVSTAQAEFEIATGIGVGIAGAAAIPVTLGGGTICAIGTAGICAIPAGGALAVEGAMVVGGGLMAGHGAVMMARRTEHAEQRAAEGRPVSSAWSDAQRARSGDVFLDTGSGQYGVRGSNGRYSFFKLGEDGNLSVNTAYRGTLSSAQRKLREGTWRRLSEDEFRAWQQLLKASEGGN